MPTPLSCRHEWNRHSCLYELLSTQTAAPLAPRKAPHFQERAAAGVAEDLCGTFVKSAKIRGSPHKPRGPALQNTKELIAIRRVGFDAEPGRKARVRGNCRQSEGSEDFLCEPGRGTGVRAVIRPQHRRRPNRRMRSGFVPLPLHYKRFAGRFWPFWCRINSFARPFSSGTKVTCASTTLKK
jgi:hypothetical protein